MHWSSSAPVRPPAREPHHEADGRSVFLSTAAPGPGTRRLATVVVVASAVIFVAIAPFATTPLVPVPAFIPIYESALVINDLVTAVLLFGQFNILRSSALLVLAAAYLFTACMTVAHALTFPGLFAPTGLLGAGPQSTAWLYMFWHGVFPLLVMGYVRLSRDGAPRPRGRTSTAVLVSAASAMLLAAGFTLLATRWQQALPPIMVGNHYTPAMPVVVTGVWALSLLALGVLWRRRRHSVIDLWLCVVLCAWLFDIALAAVLNAGRFDLGFYAGRLYGLLAASFILMVLLTENGKLYGRLVAVYRELDRQNRWLEQIVAERTARLIQSEKIATMGSLLAGVAHELNNPLSVAMATAQLLREQSGDPESLKRRADRIFAATDRCSRIVKNFLALARQRPPERGVVDLNAVVQQAVEMLAYDLRTDGVEVSMELAEGLPLLWGDAHQLHQVLVNLITNAHHAIRRASPRRVRITTGCSGSGAGVRLVVADSGPGIPAELRETIFEPFFTTKPTGEGTGLGLSLCRNIIAEHGGTITVDAHPGPGATFVIELPASAAGGRPATAETPRSIRCPGSKRQLVVDDEPDIAAVLTEILREAGHTVDVANDGGTALERLEHTSYDLVVSDTKMPGVDGIDLYRTVQRRFPALSRRFVFLTGDVLSTEKREFFESTKVPCVTKPFDVHEVRRLVEQQLDDL